MVNCLSDLNETGTWILRKLLVEMVIRCSSTEVGFWLKFVGRILVMFESLNTSKSLWEDVTVLYVNGEENVLFNTRRRE